MSAAQRTAGPWATTPSSHISLAMPLLGYESMRVVYAAGSTRGDICYVPEPAEDTHAISDANAAFIVQACNAHDALVIALEACCTRLVALGRTATPLDHAAGFQASAALALAKGAQS